MHSRRASRVPARRAAARGAEARKPPDAADFRALCRRKRERRDGRAVRSGLAAAQSLQQPPSEENTMYYGIGGTILLILVVLFFLGRL
jgi:hypothetical protein